jgi:phosphoribosylformimino-5-aminoimidazole carboxamide ribotide isomerase
MTFLIVPAIDIIDGQLVRLYKGDYNQPTNYTQSPYDMAMHYKALGLNTIHVVDLNGAKDGQLTNLPAIKLIASIPNIKIQVGGGVRSRDHVLALFDIGISRVILGSIITENFKLATELMLEFPNQIIAGIDIKDNKIATNGWLEAASVSIEDGFHRLSQYPLHSIISTDISRDGTFLGPNFDLYKRLAGLTSHSLVASGGVSSIDDIIRLKNLNLPNLRCCIVGKAIIEGKIVMSDLNQI